jgi:hypothetical protein
VSEFFESYPWVLPGSALALLVSLLAARRLGAWLGVTRPVAGLMMLNVGVMLAATLTPPACGCPMEVVAVHGCGMSRIGLAPLSEVLALGVVTGNVIALIPLGFTIALVPRPRRRAAALALAIALPFAIELTQLVVVPLGRACEAGDVVDNLTGLVIGLVAGLLAPRLITGLRKWTSTTP